MSRQAVQTASRERPRDDAGRGEDRSAERPLIGVTTSEVRPTRLAHPRPQSDPARPEMALGMTYMNALERTGAIPVVIPILDGDAIEPLLGSLAGVCLSGGPDLDPVAYRADSHPKLGPTWRDLDEFELELARRADERGIPILGICRGAQTINVARGGDLHQHLPALESSSVRHRQKDPGERLSHEVEVEPSSRLARIVGTDGFRVNSFHHQGVKRLGRGLVVSARSEDGVVEAIEDPSRPFLIGVQWHAEYLVGREIEEALFSAFVDAARWSGEG